MIEFVSISLELSEVERSGGQFQYPDALSPLEWVCLKGLTRGRDRAEGLKQERDRQEQKIKRKKDELNGNG